MVRLLTSWLLITIALTIVAPIAALLAGVHAIEMAPPGSTPSSPGALLAWELLSNGIIAGVLVNLAVRSHRRGATLVAGLFAVAFGIGHFAGLIEAWFFNVLAGATTMRLLAMGAVVSLVASVGAAWLTTRQRVIVAGDDLAPWRIDPLRLVAVAALYVVAYFAAGTLVYPFVRAFYEAGGLPPFGNVVAMQFIARGPLFGVLLSWLMWSTSGTRRQRALRAGVALALLGGVAPLLLPNPFMPEAVRWAHMVETGGSNAIFGALAGWLLAPRRPAEAAPVLTKHASA